jgi:S-formylglutathione hydrolase FrmB
MNMPLNKLLLGFLLVLGTVLPSSAAQVDTLEITSAVMQKKLKAVVVMPEGYKKSKDPYPVLYLLHGGSGGYKDWLSKTPDRTLIHRLSDQYNIIVVTPEGGATSYYFDSPLDKTSQYETFISRELIQKIDESYRTIKDKNGRVIAGLSMGGHGALYIGTRHSDLYCAAGSMSGVMNINTATWKVPEEFATLRKEGLAKLLGPAQEGENPYPDYTLVSMINQVKSSGLKIIVDCGVDDFLIDTNRDFHQKLLESSTPHDYIERPGSHTWDYWENALAYQMLFFQKVLQINGSLKK